MLSNESSYLYLLGSRRLVFLLFLLNVLLPTIIDGGQTQDRSMDSAACLRSLGKSERGVLGANPSIKFSRL